MESAFAGDFRTHPACVHCYEKKVRCTYLSQVAACVRCHQQELECVPRDSSQKKPRSSVRGGLEDLSQRVAQLEEALVFDVGSIPVDRPVQNHFIDHELPTEFPSHSQPLAQPDHSPTPPPVVKSYRGTSSPWSTLVSQLDGKTSDKDLDAFQKDATKYAEDERSSSVSSTAASYNVLRRFPNLDRDTIFSYIRAYAKDAPYPILHFDSLMQTVEQVLDGQTSTRWGQIVCVLMYMAFGCTLTTTIQSGLQRQEEAASYLQQALQMLPHLVLDHDLWALKAMTLLVHCLQASSKPEPCWALLAATSRMAISLGFHQKSQKVDAYSTIELEEGKRAWWLCHIMEKTFCTIFDYPSVSSPSNVFNADIPKPFTPTSSMSLSNNTIFGTNETSAVAFFNSMIQLTQLRDSLLSPQTTQTPDQMPLNHLLPLFNNNNNPTSQSPPSLRCSISTLAHNNALQVLSNLPTPPTSLAPLAIKSARTSLHIILNSRTKGTTMCLWMWLYYGFTAAVVVFLHCILPPTTTTEAEDSQDVMLDLALLGDMSEMCGELPGGGARRVGEICAKMEAVMLRVRKRQARGRGRVKRRIEEQHQDQDQGRREGEGEGGDARGKRTRIDELDQLLGELDKDVEGPSNAQSGVEAVINTTPQNFEWEQWMQWLDENPSL